MYYRLHISFFLASVSRLFSCGKPICREDFIRRIDMDPTVPEGIKRFAHHLQFDDAIINDRHEIMLDASLERYSDG